MAIQIGIIAEDYSDVDVLYELTSKIIAENSFSFTKRVGNGCGKLRCKCNAWANNLLDNGCSHLVVMHDLDSNEEAKLQGELKKKIRGIQFDGSLVLIPTRELEAWLLCDAVAIKKVFNLRKLPKVPKHPESIESPKEHLRDIVWKSCKRRYANTFHNQKIAAAMRITSLKACKSFSSYPQFLRDLSA